MLKAVNIKWDVDDNEDLDFLPTEIELPYRMTDDEEISDYISDTTGFCHGDFELIIGLCTFPDDDKDYCKYFEVEEKFLLDVLERLDTFHTRKGVDLENFLDNYDWTETWLVYEAALSKGKVLFEKEEG